VVWKADLKPFRDVNIETIDVLEPIIQKPYSRKWLKLVLQIDLAFVYALCTNIWLLRTSIPG
jgi:hypothetical protein